MNRKIAFLLIISVLIFSTVPSVWATEEINTQAQESEAAALVFIDDLIGKAENPAYEGNQEIKEYIELFKAINPNIVIEENLSAEMTRAKFVVTLMQVMVDSGFKSYTLFDDVDTDDTLLTEALGYAVSEKIVSESKSFRPDDGITYNEMIKMAVVALGYEVMADKYGGWPQGYNAVAQRINLTGGIKGLNGIVKAEDAYVLLYNMLTVDLFELTTVGKTYEYEIVKGSNILESRHNIHVVKGIVNSDDISGITDTEEKESKGNIKIGTTVFKNSAKKSFLGYGVKGFYRDTDGQPELLTINKYNSEEVFISEIENVSNQSFFSKDRNEKTKEYSLNKGYTVLVNGVASPDTKLKDFISRDDVTLKLIDNDSDGKFDVASLYVWDYMHVGKIDGVNKILYDANPPDNALDLGKEELVVRIYNCNGESVETSDFDSIESGSILTYALSGGKLVNIFVSKNKASGIIESQDENGELVINGASYTLSAYSRDKFKFVSLGAEVTAYIDATGKIVSFSNAGTKFSYGWIVKSGSNSSLLNDENITVKIFTQAGNMELIGVAKKIFVDNEPKTAHYFHTLEQSLGDNRLVKYSLDAEGKLKSVDFPSDYDGSKPFAEQSQERDSFIKYYDGTYMKTGIGMFDNTFKADDNTIFFSIPTVGNRSNDELYLIKNISNYRNGTLTTKAYDVVHGGSPAVCLNFSDKTYIAVDEYTGSEVVIDVVYSLDEDGNDRVTLNTYNGSKYNKYYATNTQEASVKALNPGDIVRLSVYEGEIHEVKLDYSYKTNTIASAVDRLTGDVSYVKGYVYSYGPSLLHLWRPVDITDTTVELGDIVTMDFRHQDAIFIDVYKKANGDIKEVIVGYKPLTEIRDYLHADIDASFIVCRQGERSASANGRWIYREIK